MPTTRLSPSLVVLRLLANAAIHPYSDPTVLVVENGAGVRGANSYGSLQQANSYFIGRRLYSSAWTVASNDMKATALRQASFLLDAEFTWSGTTPVNEDQGLAWPFTNATDKYNRPVTGVPKAVRDAMFELAFYLLAEDRLVARQGIGLKSLKVDTVSLVFDKDDSPQTFPSHVSRLLTGLGTAVRGSNTIRTVRLLRV